MISYCLEFGTDDSESVTVHRLDCECLDHGSLLGLGLLTNLGNYDTSLHALKSARLRHPEASRCPGCCLPDLVPPRREQDVRMQPVSEI